MSRDEFKARLLLQTLGNDVLSLVDFNETLDINHPNITASYSDNGQFAMERILCAIDVIVKDDRVRQIFHTGY
jgi:hypothetical protein